MKWINSILALILAIPETDVVEPSEFEEVKEGDKVLGELPFELRQFSIFRNRKIDEFNALKKAHRERHMDPNYDNSECGAYHAKKDAMEKELDVLGAIFWKEVREAGFEESEESAGIGLKKGWKVVELSKDDESLVIARSLDELEGALSDLLPPGLRRR